MTVCGKAFAKLNLALDVVGKTENGYHEISSVFQSVSLCDEITVESASDISVSCGDDSSLQNEDNLCFSAAKLFYEKLKKGGGAHITIKKNIPVSAGLGGGSTDAAAVLKMLNTVNGNPLCKKELSEIALQLGADVPFCLDGGTALAGGVGEKLKSINRGFDYDVIIIMHGKKSSTGELYSRLDNKVFDRGGKSIAAVAAAIEQGNSESFCCNLYNAFEAVWGDGITPQKQRLFDSGAKAAVLSGSGPSVFGIFEKGQSKVAANSIKKYFENVYVCRPVDMGNEFSVSVR